MFGWEPAPVYAAAHHSCQQAEKVDGCPPGTTECGVVVGNEALLYCCPNNLRCCYGGTENSACECCEPSVTACCIDSKGNRGGVCCGIGSEGCCFNSEGTVHGCCRKGLHCCFTTFGEFRGCCDQPTCCISDLGVLAGCCPEGVDCCFNTSAKLVGCCNPPRCCPEAGRCCSGTEICCPEASACCNSEEQCCPEAGACCSKHAECCGAGCCTRGEPMCCDPKGSPPLCCQPRTQDCCQAPDPTNSRCCTTGECCQGPHGVPTDCCPPDKCHQGVCGEPEVVWSGSGGGKLTSASMGVSVVRLLASGSGSSIPPDGFGAVAQISGSLSAFNYRSRALIQSTSFSAAQGSASPSGNLSLTTVGPGVINGTPATILLTADRIAGKLTFEVYNADTGQLLAGGIGETGRAALEVLIAPSLKPS